MLVDVPEGRRFLQDPERNTSQKTIFIIVTAVKTSNFKQEHFCRNNLSTQMQAVALENTLINSEKSRSIKATTFVIFPP
jgi:hypothetical protein